MKNLILTITTIFIFNCVNAQWYSNQFGVTNMNELNQPQLELALDQADKTIMTGKVLTFTGIGMAIIGGIVYSAGLNEIVESDLSNMSTNKAMAGALVLTAGCGMTGIGIPVWVVGDSRKKVIQIHLQKYEEGNLQGYIPGIGLKIRF